MSRQPSYDGLLTESEAVTFLAGAMGKLAPDRERFSDYTSAWWRRKYPDSLEALHLKPAARVSGHDVWRKGSVQAYAEAQVAKARAAAATYRWGRIIVDGNDADAAATAARIVFANDDLVVGTALAASYAATPPQDGTDAYQFYLAVARDNRKPTGWRYGELQADDAFQAAVTRTISSVVWTYFILDPAYARTPGDGSIDYEPETS